MMENIRFYFEEEANDHEFAINLARFADIYVNDAFSCSHRAHSSICKIPNFLPSYSGLQLDKEVNALEKITIGLRSTLITSPNMKKIIAYNEVGRAIVSAVRNGIESVDKITILPRSGSLGGYTKITPDEDIISSGLISKKFLFSKIEIALAGRAAEMIVFGKNEFTQCSIKDISYATNIVREMVTKYGFSIIGPISLESENSDMLSGELLFRRKSLIAENTSSRIDNEIIRI